MLKPIEAKYNDAEMWTPGNLKGPVSISVPGDMLSQCIDDDRATIALPIGALSWFIHRLLLAKHGASALNEFILGLLAPEPEDESPPAEPTPNYPQRTKCGCVFVKSPTETIWLVRCDGDDHCEEECNATLDDMYATELEVLANDIAAWKRGAESAGVLKRELNSISGLAAGRAIELDRLKAEIAVYRRDREAKKELIDRQLAEIAGYKAENARLVDELAARGASLAITPCGCVYSSAASGGTLLLDCKGPDHAQFADHQLKKLSYDELRRFTEAIRGWEAKAAKFDGVTKAFRSVLSQ